MFDTILDVCAPALLTVGTSITFLSHSPILYIIGIIITFASGGYIYRTIFTLRQDKDNLTIQNKKLKQRLYGFPRKNY